MKTLFVYELRKIVNRKIVWISLIISVLLILVTVGNPLFGNYYVDEERIASNYEIFQEDKAYQKALDGRLIDESLLWEMQEAYSNVPLDSEKYSRTEEYQKHARPYSVVFNYVRQITGMTRGEIVKWTASAESLHEKRLERQEWRWSNLQLTQEEKEYWRGMETKLDNPVVFRYAEGYSVLIDALYTLGLLSIFMVAICLAGVFPDEHVRKTDQLIMSCKFGRKHIFRAKFLAGVVFAFLMVSLFVTVTFGMVLLLYGGGGFDAAFQLLYVGSSCPFSVGEAVLIAYGIVILAGTFCGVFVMMLSELFRSSIATLAVVIGMLLLTMMIAVPDEQRLLAQLWSYLPTNFVAIWNVFDLRTIVLFGKVFQAWQTVPVIYSVLGVLFALVTKQVFVNYQVSGR